MLLTDASTQNQSSDPLQRYDGILLRQDLTPLASGKLVVERHRAVGPHAHGEPPALQRGFPSRGVGKSCPILMRHWEDKTGATCAARLVARGETAKEIQSSEILYDQGLLIAREIGRKPGPPRHFPRRCLSKVVS